MLTQFEKTATEIFEKAKISKEDAPIMFKEVIDILSESMATMSVTHGLSFKRAERYQAQKDALVDDLKLLKSRQELR